MKILWNILTPFVLVRRRLVTTSDKPTAISMAPFVEIVLWLLLVFLSFFSTGSGLLHSPKKVALLGLVMIVGSYVVFAVLGIALGWCAEQLSKCRKGKCEQKNQGRDKTTEGTDETKDNV
jgi:Kef-type K+ transport system membrane component KefB